MNRDDIIRMAEEAGLVQIIAVHDDGTRTMQLPHPNLLANFATLVAAAEREACAKVCDKYYGVACRFESEHRTHHYLMGKGAAVCAYKIRARGQA